MTRKKKVIIGLIAFVAFNAYVYKGAHYVPVGKMLELSEECRLLVGPSSSADSDLLEHPFRFYLNTLDQRIVG